MATSEAPVPDCSNVNLRRDDVQSRERVDGGHYEPGFGTKNTEGDLNSHSATHAQVHPQAEPCVNGSESRSCRLRSSVGDHLNTSAAVSRGVSRAHQIPLARPVPGHQVR